MKFGENNPLLSFVAAFAWWIGASALFSIFFWTTLPLEQRATARVVNAAFEAAGDSRRVSRAAPLWGADGSAALAGSRFLLKDRGETAVVFSVGGAGSSSSFVAVFTPQAGARTVLPLDPDAGNAVRRLPPGLLETYLARITASENAVLRKSKK